MPLHVKVSIHVRPERLEWFLILLANHRVATLQERGCLSFIVSQDVAEPLHFVLNESFTNREGLEAHRRTDHYRTWKMAMPSVEALPRVHLDFDCKITDAAALAGQLDFLGRIVVANGCFDMLHPGHIHTLRWAKQQGDTLLVAVNDDAGVCRLKGDGRPWLPIGERCRMLAALDCVDVVVPFSEDTPVEVMRWIHPGVLVKGPDYAGKESSVPRSDGCEVRIAPPSSWPWHSSDIFSNAFSARPVEGHESI